MTDQQQRHEGNGRRGSQALIDSLHLQQSAQQRIAGAASGRGRRRKGDVIDLDKRTVARTRRRRIFTILLILEIIVAVAAIAVFVFYLASGRAVG